MQVLGGGERSLSKVSTTLQEDPLPKETGSSTSSGEEQEISPGKMRVWKVVMVKQLDPSLFSRDQMDGNLSDQNNSTGHLGILLS